ncbi:MAG: hypothetical protein HAW63_02295 [Bdellovibrionaceae bacterium]|nr:hypothetical protein [Pseudobdellovibrionaceae bacterium]
MPFAVYKLIHVVSIFLLIFSFGLMIAHYKNSTQKNKYYSLLHGVSVAFILISGFGLLAKLSIHWPWPMWVITKVFVWLVFSVIVVLFRKKPSSLKGLISILLLGGLAAFSAIFHN